MEIVKKKNQWCPGAGGGEGGMNRENIEDF